MPSLEPELEPTDVYISLRSGLKWLPGYVHATLTILLHLIISNWNFLFFLIYRDKKYWRDMASIYWLSTMDKASQFKKAGMQVLFPSPVLSSPRLLVNTK